MSIDLAKLTDNGRVTNLSGKERGVAARRELGVDSMDTASGHVEVIVPEYLDAISPSYFQGLFSESIQRLNGRENFLDKYRFVGNRDIMRWVDLGIVNSTISRDPLF